MFNLGITELFALAIIALFVIGPDRLPGAARTLARFLNEFRRATSDFKQTFTQASKDTTDFLSKQLEESPGLNEELSEIQKHNQSHNHNHAHIDDDYSNDKNNNHSEGDDDDGRKPDSH